MRIHGKRFVYTLLEQLAFWVCLALLTDFLFFFGNRQVLLNHVVDAIIQLPKAPLQAKALGAAVFASCIIHPHRMRSRRLVVMVVDTMLVSMS